MPYVASRQSGLRTAAVKTILTLSSPQERQEVKMEEAHRTHKEAAWGWVNVLNDWRRSRTRARIRKPQQTVAAGSR